MSARKQNRSKAKEKKKPSRDGRREARVSVRRDDLHDLIVFGIDAMPGDRSARVRSALAESMRRRPGARR